MTFIELPNDLYYDEHRSSCDVRTSSVECPAQFKWSKSAAGEKLTGVWSFQYGIVCA